MHFVNQALQDQTLYLTSRIRERHQEDLTNYLQKETILLLSQNDQCVISQAQSAAEKSLGRFRETFEMPHRTSDKAVEKQDLVADYQSRKQRAMDIFDMEMVGFMDEVAVVRQRHDLEKSVDGIFDLVGSFNEAKIERVRADMERKKYEEEKKKREEAEGRVVQIEMLLKEYEAEILDVRKRMDQETRRAAEFQELYEEAQAKIIEEKERFREVERRAQEEKEATNQAHERQLEEAVITAKKGLVKPCCPIM